MKQLKTLGLALIAVFALAAVAAATASAELGEVKPGLLFLKGVTFPIALTSSGGVAVLRTAVGTMECAEFKNEGTVENENGNVPPHTELVKGVKVDFLKCKEVGSGLGCRSEAGGVKDPKETILVVADKHFIALLNSSKELRPGVLFIIPGVVMLNCGGALIELKGAVAGEVLLKESGEDITLLTVDLPTALKCDTSDELCKKLLEEKPFLVNFKGVFEPAELSAKVDVHFSEMVKVDD